MNKAKLLIQFVIAVLLSAAYLSFYGKELITTIYGLKVLTYAIPITAVIGTIAGGFFNMGVRGYSKTNILMRLLPITYVVAVLVVITTIQQTYPTAIFAGVLIGNTFSYIGKVISDSVIKGKK